MHLLFFAKKRKKRKVNDSIYHLKDPKERVFLPIQGWAIPDLL